MVWTFIGIVFVLAAIGFMQLVAVRVSRYVAGRPRLSEDAFAEKFFPKEQKATAIKVRQLLVPYLPVNVSYVHPSDRLVDDLGLSARLSRGLDVVSFVQDLEDEFKVEFSENDYYRIQTFHDVVEIITEKTCGRGSASHADNAR
jgi:acyl carrier protein